ncbi:MAG: PLDc_N domain-containing protein [Blastochloris sp.]|nr:PLDc_N domain-containing protein [Blastochloris sp.]
MITPVIALLSADMPGWVYVLALLGLAVTVWALIDCAINVPSPRSRATWICLIYFFNILAALLYFLSRIDRVPKKDKNN